MALFAVTLLTAATLTVAVTREAFDINEMALRSLLDSYEDTAKGRLSHGYLHDMKIEFYVGPAAGFGAMQLFSTGSPSFNVRCRLIAKRNGWALNQYGIWQGNTKSGVMVCDCTNELSILLKLGLPEFVGPLARGVNGYHAH